MRYKINDEWWIFCLHWSHTFHYENNKKGLSTTEDIDTCREMNSKENLSQFYNIIIPFLTDFIFYYFLVICIPPPPKGPLKQWSWKGLSVWKFHFPKLSFFIDFFYFPLSAKIVGGLFFFLYEILLMLDIFCWFFNFLLLQA